MNKSPLLLVNYLTHHLNDSHHETRISKRKAFEVLEKALNDDLKPGYYLAGLDCGGGKSTLIKDFLKIWAGCGFQPEGSVIVCVSRLEEIKRFTDESGLSKVDYAVITSSAEHNALGIGRDRATEARVLFTTQQKIKAQMNATGSFEALAEFHYMGKPRPCRIWDESLDVAEAFVIQMDQLSSLPSRLRHSYSDAVAVLDRLIGTAVMSGAGGEIVIPDDAQTAFNQIIAASEGLGLSKDQKETMIALKALAGATVGIERGIKGQLALMGAGRPVPADFLPVIVFDASARLRHTYALQEKHVGNVVRLPSVVHDYRQAKFHLWRESMGTDKLADSGHRAKILNAVAELINADAESEWLIVHRKEREGKWNIKRELHSLVDNKWSVHCIHWGDHAATNLYRNIKKVVVIGTWRKPGWVYGAEVMASSGRKYSDIANDERTAFRLAEHKHDFMQAVGRSNIRNVEDGVAGEVEVYVVMPPEKAEECIHGAFPGCAIEKWMPVEKGAKGQVAALISCLSTIFSETVTRVRKSDVYTKLGITSHNLANLVRDDRTKSFIARAGIRVERYWFEKAVLV